MDKLWAPWRMEFIEGLGKTTDCLFCNLSKSPDDRANYIFKRGASCFILLNKFPYISGHMMVTTYRHVASFAELKDAEITEMIKLASKGMEILKSELKAEGFNSGFNFGKVAGAGIEDHIHFHIVPRWVGDHNFLPVLGETRSMPEYLLDTYDRLIDKFR